MNKNRLLATLILSTLTAFSFGVDEAQAARYGDKNTDFDGTVSPISGYSATDEGDNNGGAMIYDSGTHSITGTTFSGNSASGNGGAIYNSDGVILDITGSTFSSNTATGYGNDIYNAGELNLKGGNSVSDLYNTGVVNFSNTNTIGTLNNSVGSTAKNTDTLTVTGSISGAGAFTNEGSISGSLTNTSTGTFTNKGTIGSLINSGSDFRNTDNGSISGIVTNTGEITSKADKFGGKITNTSGTLNLTEGTLSQEIEGGTVNMSAGVIDGVITNSELNVSGDVDVSNAANINNAGTITVDSGKTLTILEGAISKSINGTMGVRGTNVSLNSAITNAVVVNSGSKLTSTAANLANATVTNEGEVYISSGTLAKQIGGQKLTFATGAANSAVQEVKDLDIEGAFTNSNTLKVTNSLTNSGTIDNSSTIELSGGTTASPMSNAGIIKSTAGTGNLTVSGVVSNSGTITQNNLTVSNKLINASGHSVTVNNTLNNTGTIENNGDLYLGTTSNAGTISGTNGTLHVAGTLTNNSGKTIKQSSVDVTSGGLVANVADLSVTTLSNAGDGTILSGGNSSNRVSTSGKIGSITGSGTTEFRGYLSNDGTVNQGTLKVASGADVKNNALISAAITNNGTLESSADNLGGNVTNTNGTLNITGGSIGSTISGGSVNITGDASIGDISKLSSVGTLRNTSTLTITGNNAIGHAILNAASGTGVGTIDIQGSNVAIDADVANKIIVSGSATTTDASHIQNSVTNNGTLSVSGGAISKDITGGTLNITGDVSANASNLKADTISTSLNKSLTLTEGTLNKEISGSGTTVIDGTNVESNALIGNAITIKGSKKLTIAADKIGGGVANSGTLDLKEGILGQEVNGGTLNILGEVSTSANNLKAATINNTSNSVKLTEGTLTSGISGNGTTVIGGIDGTTVNANALISNGITINEGNTLSVSNAENIGNAVTNNGTLSIGGSTLSKAVTGGILKFTATAANSATDVVDDLVVTSGTLTNTGSIEVTNSLSNGGIIANAGILKLTGTENPYTNAGTITKGSGETSNLTIGDNVTLNTTGSITQDTISIGEGAFLNNTGSGTISAAVTNSGSLTSSAVIGTVNNSTESSRYTVKSGTIGSEVSGSGTTIIDGTVVSNAAINNKITVNEGTGKQLTIGAGNIGGKVTNNATVVLNAGELSKEITGGTLNINGAVSTSADNLHADTINNNTANNELTLTGGTLSKAIAGANGVTVIDGTNVIAENSIANKITVNDEKKLTIGAGNVNGVVTNAGTVDLKTGTLGKAINGGTLNITGDVETNADNLNADTLNNNSTLTLTAGTLSKDLTTSTGNGKLTVTGTTVKANADLTEHTLTVGETDKFTVNTAKTATVTNTLANTGEIALDGTGLLKLTTAASMVNGGKVSGNGTLEVDTNLTNNGEITSKIQVNEGKTLTSDLDKLGTNAVITNNGALELAGGTEDSHAANAHAITGNGSVSLSGYVDNSASINLTGENSKITNTGVLESNADNIQAAVSNADATYNVTGGTIAKIVSDGTLNIKGDVSSSADNLKSDTIETSSNKKLTVTDGTLTTAVTGEGTTVIDGENVQSNVSIANAITVNAGKKLTIGAGNVGGNVTINKLGSDIGALDLKEGVLGYSVTGGALNITDNVTTAAGNLQADTISTTEGKNLTLTGGELSKAITGLGTTVIDGSVEANDSIANAIVVNAGKSLTIGAGDVDGDVTLLENGELKGTLNLNAGTLENSVTDGTVNILGAVSANASDLLANSIVNNSSSNLKLTGGELSKAITGEGTTEIAGDVTTAVGAALNKVLISSGSLDTSANYLNGDVTLQDDTTLKIDGGDLQHSVTGSGDVILNNISISDFSKISTTGNTSVKEGGSINLEGDLTRDLDLASGTVKLSDKLNVTDSHTIGATLDLNGKTIDMVDTGSKYSTLTVGTLKNTADLKIDLNTSAGSVNSDKVSVGAVDGTAGAALNITSINVTNHRDENYDGANYFNFLAGTAADDVTVKLGGSETGSIKTYTNDYVYTFTKSESTNGAINVDSIKTENTMKTFMQNGGTFSITKNTESAIGSSTSETGASIGATANNGATYTINGNGNTLTGFDANRANDGYTVSETDTLSFNGTSGTTDPNTVMSNFGTAFNNQGNLSVSNMTLNNNGTAINNSATVTSADNLNLTNNTTAIQNSSTMTASNLTFSGNTTDIANSGTLNLSGTNSINSKVTGTAGTLNITAGATTVATGASVEQNKINLTTATAELNANATDILAEIANAGVVNFSGDDGTDAKGVVTKNISGGGTLNIKDTMSVGTSTGTTEVQVAQGTISVGASDNTSVVLTNYGHIEGGLINWGTIHNNSANTVQITADSVNNGTISEDIAADPDSHLYITNNATLTNNKTIEQDILTIDAGATLLNNAADSTVTVNEALNNAGTITNNLGKLILAGSHSGYDGSAYTGTAMTNTGTINGTGTTTITGVLDSTTGSVSAGTLNIGDSTVATLADRTGSLTINATNLGSAINNYVTDGLVLVNGTLTKAVNGDADASTKIAAGTNTVTNQAAIGQKVHVASGTFANDTTGSVTGDWTIDNGAVATNAGSSDIATVGNAGTFSLLAGSGNVAEINNTADTSTTATQGVNQADGIVATVNNYSRYEQTGGSATTVNNGDSTNGAGTYTISAGSVTTFTNDNADSTLALSDTGSIATLNNTLGSVTQTGGEVTTKVENDDRYTQSAGTVAEAINSKTYELSGGSVTTFTNDNADSTLALSGTGSIATLNNTLGSVTQTGGEVTTKVENDATYTQSAGTVAEAINSKTYELSGGSVTTFTNDNADSTLALSGTGSITTLNNNLGAVTQTAGTVGNVSNGVVGASGASYSISGGSVTGTVTNNHADSTITISEADSAVPTTVNKIQNDYGSVTQSSGTVTEVANSAEYNLEGGSIAKFIQNEGDLNITKGASLTLANGSGSSIDGGNITLGETTNNTIGTLKLENNVTTTAKVVTNGESILSLDNNSTLHTADNSNIGSDAVVSIAQGSTIEDAAGSVTLNDNDTWNGNVILSGTGELNLEGAVQGTDAALISDTSDSAVINVVADQTLGTATAANTNVTKGTLNIKADTSTGGDDDVTLSWSNGTLTTGDSNAIINIEEGTTLNITGGDVTLDGGSDLSKVAWNGDVKLDGASASLTLKNIIDKTRVEDPTTDAFNKSGLLNALQGNLSIDNSTVLLGNNDVIDKAVVLTLLNSSNITVGEGADVYVDSADTALWTDGGTVKQINGDLTLDGVTTKEGTDAITLSSTGGNLTLKNTVTLNNANDVISQAVTLSIAEGNTLDIQKTSTDGVTLNSGDTWEGIISQTGGVLTLTGRDDATSTTQKYNLTDANGTLNLDNSKLKLATVDSSVTAGSVNLKNGSTLTFDNGLTTNAGVIVSDGGTTANTLTVGGDNATKLTLSDGSSIKADDTVTVKENSELTATGTMIASAITNDGTYNLSGNSTTPGTIAKAIADEAGDGSNGVLNLTGITESLADADVIQKDINVGDGTNADVFTMGDDITAANKLTINENATVKNAASTITANDFENKGTIAGVTDATSGETTYGNLTVNGNGSSVNGSIDAAIIKLLGNSFDNDSDMTAHTRLENDTALDNSAVLTSQILTNTGTIAGSGDLIVKAGGSSSGAISQANITLGEDGSSTAVTFDNNANMTATVKLTNEDNSTLENSAIINALEFVNDGTIENQVITDASGSVISTGTIAGGTLTNNDTVNNYGSITSTITNNAVYDATSGDLIGAIINNLNDGTIGVVDSNTGIINSKAAGLTGNISNSDGIINLAGGDLNVDIKNTLTNVDAEGYPSTGTLNVTDDLNVLSSIIQKDIEVSTGKNVTNKDGGSIKAAYMHVDQGIFELEKGSNTDVTQITIDKGTLSLVDDADLSTDSNVLINDGSLQLTAKTMDVAFRAPVDDASTYGIIADSSRSPIDNPKKVTIDTDISNADYLRVTGIDAYDDSVQGSILDLGANAIESLNTAAAAGKAIPVTMGEDSQLSLNATDSVLGTNPNVVFSAESITGSNYTLNINNDDSPSTVTLNTSTQGAKQVNVKSGILETIDNTNLNSAPVYLEGTGDAEIDFNPTGTIYLTSNITGVDNAGTSTTVENHKVVINNQDATKTSGDELTEGLVKVTSTLDNVAIDAQAGELWLAYGSKITDDSTVAVQDGATLNVIDKQISEYGGNYTLKDGAHLKFDAHLTKNMTDSFKNANVEGNVVLEEFSPIEAEWIVHNDAVIDLKQSLGIDNISFSDNALKQRHLVMTPIRQLEGMFDPGSGTLKYVRTGDEYENFNPAIFNSSVAAQLGGYLTQLNSYQEAFGNMDMYSLMTREERQARKFANKYAASDSGLVYSPLSNPNLSTSAWFRPYTTFEKVGLRNGPKVSNVSYGTFAGLESGLYDLGRGWDANFGVYAGYNGSHQTYQGNGIYQNGATLGLVGMAFKNNFFVGSTINVSDNIADVSNMYGKEDFNMLMSGAAVKTGYNWELAKGKFIIQPSFQTSYSFVKAFDYNNAVGVRVHNDPLHAIQLEPQIKLIGNLKHGWQPYLHLSGVWNILDKTNVRANDVSLPELSVKPYAKYGFGVRKTFGDRTSGYFQTFFTSGGRSGMGLQFGFKIKVGESKKKPKVKDSEYIQPTANSQKRYITKDGII